MNIKVNVKQLGAKRDKIGKVDFYLETEPRTVRELIVQSVHTCVADYNRRVKRGHGATPLSREEIARKSEIGKIAFGINYGEKEAKEEDAVKNALLAYEDGLFCIFIGETEAGGLEDAIVLGEGDAVTFIRLTMLSGRV